MIIDYAYTPDSLSFNKVTVNEFTSDGLKKVTRTLCVISEYTSWYGKELSYELIDPWGIRYHYSVNNILSYEFVCFVKKSTLLKLIEIKPQTNKNLFACGSWNILFHSTFDAYDLSLVDDRYALIYSINNRDVLIKRMRGSCFWYHNTFFGTKNVSFLPYDHNIHHKDGSVTSVYKWEYCIPFSKFEVDPLKLLQEDKVLYYEMDNLFSFPVSKRRK